MVKSIGCCVGGSISFGISWSECNTAEARRDMEWRTVSVECSNGITGDIKSEQRFGLEKLRFHNVCLRIFENSLALRACALRAAPQSERVLRLKNMSQSLPLKSTQVSVE